MKKLAPLYQLREINPDFGVVVAYGQILPQRILDTAKFSFLNGHASDLPRWRGAAPMERCLMEGDPKTAMCIMDMTAGLDEGDVLSKEVFNVEPDWSIRELNYMQHSCSKLLLKVLHTGSAFDEKRLKQEDTGITYAANSLEETPMLILSIVGDKYSTNGELYGIIMDWYLVGRVGSL